MPINNTWGNVKATYQDWLALYNTHLKWWQVVEGEL